MYLNDIEATCFIMALFIRDDGLRFLLGTGAYEFKDSQLHFSGNTIENDVVSIQGNDGYMLAGQVRRPSTQVFDGYIGDATIAKSEIEGFRRDFFAFFRKNHFYTVVYVLPDGSAIQRRRGFLVDAPTVKELRQMYPEYHVGLNFEDVNYYKYAEDDAGQEIYGKSAEIGLAKEQFGGLIWDDRTQTQINKSGSDFAAIGTIDNETIDSIELQGDTKQNIISGAQLLTKQGMATPGTDSNFWASLTTSNITKTDNSDGWANIEQIATGFGNFNIKRAGIANFEVSTVYTIIVELKNVSGSGTIGIIQTGQTNDPYTSYTIVQGASASSGGNAQINIANPDLVSVLKVTTKSSFTSATQGFRAFTRNDVTIGSKFDIRVSILAGDHSSDWENYAGANWQPFVGAVASPNPDYPQEVKVVGGSQVINIHRKNLFNPFDIPNYPHTGSTTLTTDADGTINMSGNTSSNGYCRVNQPLKVVAPTLEAGGTYYLYVDSAFDGGTRKQLYIYSTSTMWANGTAHTFTQDELDDSFAIYGGYNETSKIKIMITKVNDTKYETYDAQTYLINLANGKNIFGVKLEAGNFDSTTGMKGTSTTQCRTVTPIQVKPSTEYTGSLDGGAFTSGNWRVFFYNKEGGYLKSSITTETFTTPADCYFINFHSTFIRTRYPNFDAPVQIEEGSTDTSYEAYSTAELCKIGTHQDYIYKNNGNWYVHKETAKVAISDGTYVLTNDCPQSANSFPSDRKIETLSYYKYGRFNSVTTGITGTLLAGQFGWNTANRLTFAKYDFASLQAFTDFVTNNNPYIYYILATATDTQITDATLISQLEALNAATTFDDITWFKSSSEYLPVIMNVDLQAWVGGGVSWDANGAEWEDGGGGQIVNVTIDSIDSVYPVWIVNGEAINPTLTNLTTGMSIAYNGTVASGQTLVIDLLNKTAKLSGTSVIQDVSGQWVEFTPGVNRVSYSTSNPDAPDSSIEWQEVVG